MIIFLFIFFLIVLLAYFRLSSEWRRWRRIERKLYAMKLGFQEIMNMAPYFHDLEKKYKKRYDKWSKKKEPDKRMQILKKLEKEINPFYNDVLNLWRQYKERITLSSLDKILIVYSVVLLGITLYFSLYLNNRMFEYLIFFIGPGGMFIAINIVLIINIRKKQKARDDEIGKYKIS